MSDDSSLLYQLNCRLRTMDLDLHREMPVSAPDGMTIVSMTTSRLHQGFKQLEVQCQCSRVGI
jgi:hypothetical protein